MHVNVAQILKFMPNYMFNPADYPEIGTRNDPADDVFFWAQGPARGASKVQFADWATVYEKHVEDPECRAVLRAGPRAQGAAGHRRAGRRPDARPRLPAGRRAPVHAGRVRPADPRAGRSDRARRRPGRPDLRSPDPRLLPIRRRAARKAEFDYGATGLGAGRRAQARRPTPTASTGCGSRSGPTTAPTRCGPSSWGRPAAPGFAELAIAPNSWGRPAAPGFAELAIAPSRQARTGRRRAARRAASTARAGSPIGIRNGSSGFSAASAISSQPARG